MKKVVIAGGNGFIGRYFNQRFQAIGYDVLIVSTKPGFIPWSDKNKLGKAIDGSDLLINLAGKSVDCKYNKRNKRDILLSRTETTGILGEVVSVCKNPPPLWINFSTATIYRHADDRPMTEETGEIGTGFSVDVANQWEAKFFAHNLPLTRLVALRTAIVLGKNGGVLKPLANLVACGLGGRQGPGRQMFSWIHIEDLFRIIIRMVHNKNLRGVFNCSSPTAITNREFMDTLRQVIGFPFGLPIPEFLLEFGAFLLGTETELVLKSRWVYPEKLLNNGFVFRFNLPETALKEIFSEE